MIRRLALAPVTVALAAIVAVLLAGPALLSGPATGWASAPPPPSPPDTVEVHFFSLSTCPHCADAREFFAELADEVPELVVHEHEVSSDVVEQRLFVEMTAALGGSARAVPTVIVGEQMWVGFSDGIAAEIRAAVEAVVHRDAAGGGDVERDGSELVDVPGFGSVDVGSKSLLMSTVVIAFVDGVNPCSLWVLSILLALVLHGGSRRRVTLVGSVFLFVTTALYGLYVVGAYSLLNYVSYVPWIQRAVAAVVAVLALVNLRDYFRDAPATLSIPDSAKPGIYRRARGLIAPERSALAVVAGTALLAAGVSLVETPCSAALPLLWTDLLASHDASVAAAVTLFALYMVIFLLDELVLFGAVVVTMRATRLQERHGRLLRLVSGSVMVSLAAAMLLDPDLLSNVAGTAAVLAATVVVALSVALVADVRERGRRSPRPRGRRSRHGAVPVRRARP